MRNFNPLIPAAFLLAAGCAAKPEFIVRPFVPPGRIAVLAFANESNNPEAPQYLRELVCSALRDAGYDLLPLESVDRKLRDAGISQGGQIETKSPQELSDLLKASALLYATVRSFDYVTLGFYQRREVSISARLVSFGGAQIWRDSAKIKQSRIYTRKLREKFVRQLTVKALESIFSHPLYPEMFRAVKRLFMTLPAARDPHVPTGKFMSPGRE